MTSLELSGSTMNINESKRSNMKQFVDAAKEYLKTKSEKHATQINRHLQVLSVEIDLSIFDPNTSIVFDFFMSLQELMMNIEQRSTMAWNCVEVLSDACRNSAARSVIIQTYQFLSPLSRLLGDHLPYEKKVRLLNLLQELTCGIKISWQIPNLQYLMSTLTGWVENGDEQIVAFSLGILVNLCYKNFPAFYTLSRCVDIKKFMRICMCLQGIKTEAHVCKFLIIMDYFNGQVTKEALLKMTQVTFRLTIEAFNVSDAILLRHTVEFFLDNLKESNNRAVIVEYENYQSNVESLLKAVEAKLHINQSGDSQSYHPECMSLLFEFLHAVIEIKFSTIAHLCPRIMTLALDWIQTDIASTQAMSVLRTIAINGLQHNNVDLEPIARGIPLLLTSLSHGCETSSANMEQLKRVGALFQLFRAFLRVDGLRDRILQDIKEDVIEKIFAPLISGNPGNDNAACSPEAISLYVYALGLVDELTKHSASWFTGYSNLMQQKQVHLTLAQALYNGPKDVKKTILDMSASKSFPSEALAACMVDVQGLVQNPSTTSKETQEGNNICFPIISVAQIEGLDEVILELKEAISQNKLSNISTSNVMELYEYKLAAMGQAERAAMASIEAASQRCLHFEHRTAHLSNELSRLHQSLIHAQQFSDEAVRNKDQLIENNKLLENRMLAERGKYKACSSQLQVTERELGRARGELEEMTRRNADAESERNELKGQIEDLRKILAKMEDNLRRKEKVVEKKEEALAKTLATVETLKTQKNELEKQLGDTEKALEAKLQELEGISQELELKRQVLETITKVATSQMQ